MRMRDPLVADAEMNDPYACLALGYFMETGKELDMDAEGAVTWYEKAASLGCARAHWELSRIFSEGNLVPVDREHAFEHLRSSAELGNINAQMSLATSYIRGEMVPRDRTEAFRWFSRAAEQGSSLAKFYVGYMYSMGIGVVRSETEAEIWFSSAAITGDGDLFLRIGMSYEYGLSRITPDLVEAARWYKYGVDMGHEKCIVSWTSVMETLGGAPQESMESRIDRLSRTEAQRELDARDRALADADRLLDEGDEDRAYEAYSRAADLGSPDAMFAVAMMRHNGIGVQRSDLDAIKMLSRAANAGSADAQFYLARTYESNRFPTDDTQIVRLYSDAAFNGFLAAFYYLSKYVEKPEVYIRRTHTRSRRCPSRPSSRPPRTATPMPRRPWGTSSSEGTASRRTAGRLRDGSASPPIRGTRRLCATSRTSRPTATASGATSPGPWSSTSAPPRRGTRRPCSTSASCTPTSRACSRTGRRPGTGTEGPRTREASSRSTASVLSTRRGGAWSGIRPGPRSTSGRRTIPATAGPASGSRTC